MKQIEIEVSDMSCGHCTQTVESALTVVQGVEAVEVSLDRKRATVRAEDTVDPEKLREAVRTAGYTPGAVR